MRRPEARLSRPQGGNDKQDPKGKESANDGEGIVVHQPFCPKEGTVKKPLVVLFGILALILPLMFFGCSGDDGSTGATGAQGPEGPQGPGGDPGTGVAALETCSLCHGVGKIVDLVPKHGNFTPANQGTVTATIDSVTFGAPVGDNVRVSVTFTFTR